MGGKYAMEELGEQRLTQWAGVELNPEMSIPQNNKYLAEDTSMKTDEPSREWPHMKKIKETDCGELFFRADSKFDLPRGFIILLLRNECVR